VDAGDAAKVRLFITEGQKVLKDIGDDIATYKNTKDPSTIAHINSLVQQLKLQSNDLLAALQIKDANTVAFITAIVQDAVDLAGLIPVIAAPRANDSRTVVITQPKSDPKALKAVFKLRVANLPQ
jgi:hypothetical protein